MVVDEDVFVLIIASGLNCGADAAVKLFHVGGFVVAGRDYADPFHASDHAQDGRGVELAALSIAGVPFCLATSIGAFCAFEDHAQSGRGGRGVSSGRKAQQIGRPGVFRRARGVRLLGERGARNRP